MCRLPDPAKLSWEKENRKGPQAENFPNFPIRPQISDGERNTRGEGIKKKEQQINLDFCLTSVSAPQIFFWKRIKKVKRRQFFFLRKER